MLLLNTKNKIDRPSGSPETAAKKAG